MKNPAAPLRKMIKLGGENKKVSTIIVLCLILSTSLEAIAISAVFPLLSIMLGMEINLPNETLKFFADTINQFNPIVIAAFVTGCFIVKSLILHLAFHVIAKYVSSFANDLRGQFIDAVLKAKVSYINGESLGKSLTVLTNDSMVSAQAFISFTRTAANLLQVLLYTAYALWLSAAATVISLITVLILSLVIRSVLNKSRTLGKETTLLAHAISKITAETLRGLKAAKAMAKEDFFANEITATSNSLRNVHRKNIVIGQTLRNIQDPILIASALTSLILLKDFLQLDSSHILFILAVYYRLMSSINTLQADYQKFLGQEPALNSIQSMTNQATSEREEIMLDGLLPAKVTEDISLKKISLCFLDKVIFSDASFNIPKKKLTLIKGSSGSGKTTLVDMICAMIKPDQGQITIGETNLSEITTKEWRKQIGYVDQFPFLFKGTIKENILLDNTSISTNDFDKCIEKAHLRELISSLSNGVDHILEEGGSNISGGQRQRIAIARAIARNPNYLILDEPTSALDAESSKVISETLLELSKHLTVIVVTHSSDMDSFADHIINLDHGTDLPPLKCSIV